MKRMQIHIGTSGWVYPHWTGVFYPSELPSDEKLTFYSQHFSTVEINSSFYHLPREMTFVNWAKKVPEDFIFAVKGSSFITHRKRLIDVEEPVRTFLERAKFLGKKLGPILWQMPPSLKYNKKRMEKFFQLLLRKFKYAIEVRHPSFLNKEFFELLKKYQIAFCMADTPRFPYAEEITGDFIYLRLHGHEELYASKYSEKQLKDYATKFLKWQKAGVKEIFCYFDNDFQGFAVKNALQLKNFVGVDKGHE